MEKWEQEIESGIFQMKKYQKTKRIQAKERRKKIIIEIIILWVMFFVAYGLILYLG